jgi:hypothetical protein
MRTLFCLLLLISFHPVKAATINALSGSFVDVSNAIAKATYGDTVQIPAGTWTWTQTGLSFSGITIAGAGTNATFILDNLPNGWGNFEGFLYGVPVTNSLTRLTGITFADGGNPTPSYKGKILMDGRAVGTSAAWRIDHCMFVNLNGGSIYVYGFPVSVIDHCSFVLKEEGIFQYGLSTTPINDIWGDYPWYVPATYGGTNQLYIENCFFTNGFPTGAEGVYDGEAGARSVFRNNTVMNCAWASHGNDTSGRYRSIRSYEIYNNTFIDDRGWTTPMDFRGGTGVVFSNTMVGYSQFDSIENYRDVQPNSFGAVDGLNPWDNTNGIVYYTGTNSATGFNVTNSGANWTPHQWAGYVIRDPTAGTIVLNGAGSVNSCLIQDNTANQLIITPPKDFQIVFTNKDVFKIYYVSSALDQVGRGSGDLIQDVTIGQWPNSTTYTIDTATGTNTWPHQVLEPLYSWGNTLNGSPAGIASGYANILEGRDIFKNAVKPGYTPLFYPHPLVSGISTPPPMSLSPPSSLQAH